MSELSSIARIYGTRDELERIQAMLQQEMGDATVRLCGQYLEAENIASFYDFSAYDKMKAAYPETLLLSYEFSHSVGEPSFCFSNYGNKRVGLVNPYDDDEFDDEDEDAESGETWYREVYDEVGSAGLLALKEMVDSHGDGLFEDIPQEYFMK